MSIGSIIKCTEKTEASDSPLMIDCLRLHGTNPNNVSPLLSRSDNSTLKNMFQIFSCRF